MPGIMPRTGHNEITPALRELSLVGSNDQQTITGHAAVSTMTEVRRAVVGAEESFLYAHRA